MWTYSQKSGEISRDGVIVGVGYAGHGEGFNNPAMQEARGVGPIPRGRYTIGPAYTHDHLGPLTMNLEPDPANEMFGRSLFRIHGRKSMVDKDASDGCIVQDHTARAAVSDSLDRALEVTL